MQVSILQIKPHVGASAAINLEKQLPIDDYSAKISLTGVILNKGDSIYEFDGTIKGLINVYCAKCLKSLEIPYEEKIVQIISSIDTSDSDVFICEGDIVDFELLVAGIIRADMPIAFFCTDACKGMCEICGKDLNESSCSCVKEYTNPIFNDLRKLFIDNEEV